MSQHTYPVCKISNLCQSLLHELNLPLLVLYAKTPPFVIMFLMCLIWSKFCVCRTYKLQVMRVESTNGEHQEIGLYIQPDVAARVLAQVRSLQPYKPWQFKSSMRSSQVCSAAWLFLA